MPRFTDADVNLINRACRLIQTEAAQLFVAHSPWTSEKESKEWKAKYDRYLREARDLAELRGRMRSLVAEQAALVPHKGKEPGHG